MPDATIHAPIRERNLTRSWEIEYAPEKGFRFSNRLTQNMVRLTKIFGAVQLKAAALKSPTMLHPKKSLNGLNRSTMRRNRPRKPDVWL